MKIASGIAALGILFVGAPVLAEDVLQPITDVLPVSVEGEQKPLLPRPEGSERPQPRMYEAREHLQQRPLMNARPMQEGMGSTSRPEPTTGPRMERPQQPQRPTGMPGRFMERASTTLSTPEARREAFMEKRAQLASSTEARREAFAARVGERATERFSHAASLMDAMIVRLSGIADRIEARIANLPETSDITGAEEALADARTAIGTAESSSEALKSAVAEALSSETPRESLAALRPQAESVKADIKNAHAALVAAVRATAQTSGVATSTNP